MLFPVKIAGFKPKQKGLDSLLLSLLPNVTVRDVSLGQISSSLDGSSSAQHIKN
jgi:hypothetical protein